MQTVARLAGCVCVIAACQLVGWEQERKLKRRWLFLRELQEVFSYLEKEMTYHRTPIETALRIAADNCTTVLREVLLTTADEAEQRQGIPFRNIWENAANNHIPAALLAKEQFDVLCESASALCGSDTVMQRTMLKKYEDRFALMSQQEELNCREKGSLYRKLATAAGIFLVILLI